MGPDRWNQESRKAWPGEGADRTGGERWHRYVGQIGDRQDTEGTDLEWINNTRKQGKEQRKRKKRKESRKKLLWFKRNKALFIVHAVIRK